MKRPRRGVALLVTLGVVLLLAVASVGAFYVAVGDHRRARGAPHRVVVDAAADAAAWEEMLRLRLRQADTLPAGAVSSAITATFGDASTSARSIRTGTGTWWVVASALAPDSSSTRVAVALRQDLLQLPVDAALTVRDAVRVHGTGQVIGSDSIATGIGIPCPPTATVAGVALPDTTRATVGTVLGIPPLLAVPSLATLSAFTSFGSASWSSLGAAATITLPPGSVITPAPRIAAGSCDPTAADNWGDVTGAGPCARYAPIVLARGALTLDGGSGQGILLVDGDLVVRHGARFHGLVLVRDDISAGPGGGLILGGALAADSVNGPGDASDVGDAMTVRWSSCAVTGALRRHAPWIPVARRAWAPLR